MLLRRTDAMISRRRWLQLLGLSGLGSAVSSAGPWNPSEGVAQAFRPEESDVRFSAESDSLPAFEETPSSKSGISWLHAAGQSPEMYMPETVGPGCAFLDYDNDGWMDIYLVNSGPCDFFEPPRPLRNALYKNNRDGTFTDVTMKAGVAGDAYGMGVAVGDYDGDGLPDIYLTQYPHSILYHNNGDETFTDVTAKAGVAAP